VNSGGFSAFAGPGPSAFAAATSNPPTSSGSVFGQSAFSGSDGGVQPGQSAFGPANSVSTNSAFGRPNAFSPTSGSGFGPTSPFGVANNAASAFGQHAPSLAPAFGQTSTSSTSPTVSPFAQPAPNTSTFGQSTSAFGQPTAATSAFSPNATTPFGQSTSAFGTRAPAQQSAFGQALSPVSPGGPKPHARSAVPDFANSKSTYKPGLNPYDALLPTNYSSLLPDNVRAAFTAPRFSWDNVPDWIPPLDMR
jgi:nucleoporin NUP42